ncbi:MAG: GNAT family N-acetyltransferase [Armatimonadetes bacterium]|nr:GNAT family N-acetyltransferase [Armatimonadota bacterium]
MVRSARPEDVPRIHELILELAEYERLRDRAVGTPELLHRHLFGEHKYVEALVVEIEGALVGYALFFTTYSTFLTLPGYWLEDLFVEPASRGKGYGKALLLEIVRLARVNGFGRVEWSVLDWNQPSIDFYESLGARALGDWTVYRLEGAALGGLARS